MTLSTRLKNLRDVVIDESNQIDIVEEVPFNEYVMEELSKKVSSIPVWKEYEYSKQFELVMNFLENKIENEFVDLNMTSVERRALAEEFLKTNNGFGLLDRFLAKSEVNAVMVNSYGSVYVHSYDEFRKTSSVLSENQFYEITARFKSESQIVRVRQDNLFITILRPPVSDNMIIIKKIKDVSEDLNDLPSLGQISKEMVSLFKYFLKEKKNIVISGNTQAGVCEFIQILQNSLNDDCRISIIEDSGFYRPAMDNVSSFSVASLDDLDYEFLLDSVLSLNTDYVIADISDNSKFLSYYSQLSTTEKGLITGVRSSNPLDVSGKFVNAAMISSKCTEKQAKLRFSSIYDYVIHVENVKDKGFRVDSVMEITSSKTNPLVMNEVVKFVDGVFVLDLPAEFASQKSSFVSHSIERPTKSLRSRLKS